MGLQGPPPQSPPWGPRPDQGKGLLSKEGDRKKDGCQKEDPASVKTCAKPMTPGHILGPERWLLGPLVRTLASQGVWREYRESGPVWSPGWAGRAVGRMARRPALWGDPAWTVLSAEA